MQLPATILSFASTDGLDLPGFNTIRLGRGPAQRLRAGDIVLLAHKDQALRWATVTMTAFGRCLPMLEHWAALNHMELHLAQQPGYDASQAPARRLESLRRIYGPHRLTDSSFLSVIGLAPLVA